MRITIFTHRKNKPNLRTHGIGTTKNPGENCPKAKGASNDGFCYQWYSSPGIGSGYSRAMANLTEALMTVLHRLLLTVFFLIAVSPVFAAGPSEHVRAIVSGIVTYTRWPSLTGAPKLCIFASSRFTHSLAHEDPDALPYQPVIVRNSEEALKTTCDGFYFGSETPTQQSELTRRYGSRPLLLIAEQNTDCSIGSAFCLIINDDRVRFSVNLDVLTHSGVRVNPDVLMLARKKPHE